MDGRWKNDSKKSYRRQYDFECIWKMEVTNSMNTTKTYKPVEKLFKYKGDKC